MIDKKKFADALIENIINIPDAEILKEVEDDYGDKEAEADIMRNIISEAKRGEMKTEKQRVIDFLELNGWEKSDIFSTIEESDIFTNKTLFMAIEIGDDHVELLVEGKYTVILPTNVYAVLGAMLHFGMIETDYKFPEGEG